MKLGVLPYMNGIQIPWTVPAGIAGFISGGWRLAVWELIDLTIGFAIYFPFIKRYDKILLAKEQEVVDKNN